MKNESHVGTEESQIKFEPGKIPVLNGYVEQKNPRVFRPRINLQACTNEYNCIIFCPHDAIDKNDKGRPVVDYNMCTGCLICLRECPPNAISEEREIK